MQTESFDNSVKQLRLSEDEVHDIVTKLSENLELGELMAGTGGARKWRVPTRHKGKRTGYRIVSYFAGDDIPVFLLDIFAKGEKLNLTKAERNELRKALGCIADDYREYSQQKVAELKKMEAKS